MSDYKVNVAIQVLPMVAPDDVYPLVDKAIEVIHASGLKYKVCPFETVVEGKYDEIMNVLKTVQETCMESGAEELLINLKMQIGKNKDIRITDKIDKYL